MDSGLCFSCHTSDRGGRETLHFDGNVSRLCLSCHDGRRATRAAHQVDLTPSPAIAPRIPAKFPLERGKLTCLTCHDIGTVCRADQGSTAPNRDFLRGGRPANPSIFCFHCHVPEDYRPFNAHDQLEDGKPKTDTCLWCHVGVPEVKAKPSENGTGTPKPISRLSDRMPALRMAGAGVCRNCHTVGPEHPVRGHLGAVPPAQMLWYMSAYEMQSAMRLPLERLIHYARTTRRAPRSIPLDEGGRITCSSCHNPHEKGLLPSSNPRAIGAEPKQAVNHRIRRRDERLCVVCHRK